MVWRPDKVICTYRVGDVDIREEKFIAAKDVACSIITSASPVTLRFDGHSLVIPKLSIDRTAKVRFDQSNNAVHITEGGTVVTHAVEGETCTGRLIYDGMSTVVSSSAQITSYAAQADDKGRQVYSFQAPCDRQGVAITWAMDDEYAKALASSQSVLADYRGALAAKTKAMNDLLNYQIPYFRCSDQEIVNVYYYLWAIYLMYYIDVGQGWEMYPHTQTAVNNFLGMHRYDANFQIKVGAWTADKDYFAYGNVLHWKPLLPYARRGGALPDNKGIAWFSPVWGTTTEHVIGAWQIYQHTGDVDFLHECYDEYFKLLFKDGMHGHWGCHYDAAEQLREMAILTGDPEDPDRWPNLVRLDGRDHWLKNMWEEGILLGDPAVDRSGQRLRSDQRCLHVDSRHQLLCDPGHVQLPRGTQRQPDRPGSLEEIQYALGHPDRARGLEQSAGAVGRPVFQFQRRQDPVDPRRYGRPGILDTPKRAYRMRQHARTVEFHGIADTDEGRRPNVLAPGAIPAQ